MARIVGRARELGTVWERLDRAGAGRGSAALLTGEAGIGKSRLVREVGAEAAERGWHVIEGRCVAVGDEPLRRAALLELLRAEQAPGSASGAAGASTEELLERVLALVDEATPARPRLVVVEDVHWADRATCEVLMVLARHVTTRPALLLLTSRDDELPRGHPVRGFLAELRRAQLVACRGAAAPGGGRRRHADPGPRGPDRAGAGIRGVRPVGRQPAAGRGALRCGCRPPRGPLRRRAAGPVRAPVARRAAGGGRGRCRR